jgi:hypothetical protein
MRLAGIARRDLAPLSVRTATAALSTVRRDGCRTWRRLDMQAIERSSIFGTRRLAVVLAVMLLALLASGTAGYFGLFCSFRG